MHSPKRPSPRDSGLISHTVESVLTAGAVVLMLASVIGLVALIATAFIAPKVGDIVLFRPGTSVAEHMSFAAHRTGKALQPGAACALDPNVMLKDGGSLVVEAKLLKLHEYQLHWAGGPTAKGTDNCGRSVNLLMKQSDLETLVNAMGGRGLAGRGDVF